MQKKLPKVFANTINEVHNNDSVFYSSKDIDSLDKIFDDSDRDEKATKKLKGTTVSQKINEIFNSPYYIYKADVEITLENEVVTKKIIGKNQKNLITMDNELIPIETIQDIKYK